MHKLKKTNNKIRSNMGTFLALLIGSLIVGLTTWGLNKQSTSEARKENYELNEQAAENADVRTRNLYTDIQSPKAQIDQLKEAGLSPSRFYSDGNVGGATSTGAMGAGVAGLANPTLSMGTPSELAQIKLATAQANNLDADTANKKGEGAMGKATLAQMYSQIGLQDAQKRLTDIQYDLSTIDKLIKGETTKETIEQIQESARYAKNNADYMFYKAVSENWNSEYLKETFATRIDEAKQDLFNKQIEYYVKLSEKELNEEQRAKISAEIESIYNELFYYNETTLLTKEAYTNWLNEQAKTLKEQLTLRAKELSQEKTKMWLDFGADMFDTTAKTLGMLFLGKGGKGGAMQGVGNPVFQPYNTNGASGANAYNPHKITNWYQ